MDLVYGDRALATVNYTGLAAAGMPREQLTVHQAGSSWELTDFVRLRQLGKRGKRWRLPFADMGHRRELEYFCDLLSGRSAEAPDPLAASRVALTAREQLRRAGSAGKGVNELGAED